MDTPEPYRTHLLAPGPPEVVSPSLSMVVRYCLPGEPVALCGRFVNVGMRGPRGLTVRSSSGDFNGSGGRTSGINRRQFLGGAMLATAAAVAWRPSVLGAQPPEVSLPGDPFTLGVGSGDPLPDRVVLWTRLAPEPDTGGGMPAVDVPVVWEMAVDEAFTNVVATGTAVAPAALAHSVHVDAGAGPEGPLAPNSWFFYRFTADGYTSPVGRTRTAPANGADVSGMRFAFASCQSYSAGYYTAHANLAQEPDIDLVLFLGDYIYEGAGSGVRTVRGGEATDRAGYRDRYAQYRSDENLQATHAMCPWVVVWDDHEVDNNYANDIDENGSGGAGFLTRRQQAYLAWWEHQAVRMPAPVGPDLEIYRAVTWGRLATFFAIDGRQYRSPQVCNDPSPLPVVPRCDDMDDPSRTMLGTAQENWLTDGLRASQGLWNVVAQQTVFAATPIGFGGGDLLVNNDQWDGYPAARQRLINVFAEPDVTNPVVITGDIHASGAGRVLVDFDNPDSAVVAHEFVGTSISSTFPPELATTFNTVAAQLPWIEYVNASLRGYVTVELTTESATATWRVVDTVGEPVSAVRTDFRWVIPVGAAGADNTAGGSTQEGSSAPLPSTPAGSAVTASPSFTA